VAISHRTPMLAAPTKPIKASPTAPARTTVRPQGRSRASDPAAPATRDEAMIRVTATGATPWSWGV
jgi:hypothetical protein